MKRFFYQVTVCVLLLATLVCACSCKKREEDEPLALRPTYDTERLSEYVRLEAYTDLSVTLETADSSKGDAVWSLILSRAEVLTYPEEAVAYYAEQERQVCRYYAERNDLSYEDALEQLGLSEETILDEARGMVKGDLVYEYIREDADVALTETEKASLFDRYAERFAEQYGYEISEVKNNMAELVYESMLYDKTMEYLIVHNTFTVAE